MADKGITSLTAGPTALDGTEVMQMVDGANSRKTTSRQVADIGLALATQAGTAYTAVATDRGTWIRFTNAAAVAFTIDTGVHTAGDEITGEQTTVGGVVTITAGAGVTINSRGALIATNGTFAVFTLKCISTGVFTLVGDLA